MTDCRTAFGKIVFYSTMKFFDCIPRPLVALANACSFPIYAVGGSVRDFLAGYVRSESDVSDWDICAPVLPEIFAAEAEKAGFCVRSVYRNTGTVKLIDECGTGYEFTSFRSDEYVRGKHTPEQIYFTSDIAVDARRRDFTCNAVYYDVAAGKLADPLGGVEDIAKKTVRTVRAAERVFGEDGLRLLRLARQSAQLGFSPDEESKAGAKKHASLIADIAPERIWTELNLLLTSDEKYGVEDGAYRGLKILQDTDVLGYILPELQAGAGQEQRSDFHRYDVLEHSLRCVRYAPVSVRTAALLHDVGKPFCLKRDGNVHDHPSEGARIAREILTRLKAPKKETDRICRLVLWHMYDVDLKTGERKVRRFLAENYDLLPDLSALKQADFSACRDDLSKAPVLEKWERILFAMRQEGVPFSLKELKIDGKDLLNAGMPPAFVGKCLKELWLHCVCFSADNERERLLKLAFGFLRGGLLTR